VRRRTRKVPVLGVVGEAPPPSRHKSLDARRVIMRIEEWMGTVAVPLAGDKVMGQKFASPGNLSSQLAVVEIGLEERARRPALPSAESNIVDEQTGHAR